MKSMVLMMMIVLTGDVDQEDTEAEGEESAPAEDLFSEIHLGQLKKVFFFKLWWKMIEIVSVLWPDDCDDCWHISSQLERQLENVESEKAGLSTSVREVQDHLDLSRKELATQRVIIHVLSSWLL